MGNNVTNLIDPSGLEGVGTGTLGAAAPPRPLGSSTLGQMLYDAANVVALWHEFRGDKKREIDGKWVWVPGNSPSPINRWKEDADTIPLTPVPTDTIKSVVEGDAAAAATNIAFDIVTGAAIGAFGKGLKKIKTPRWGATPQGRPFTKHYGTETGPVRNIPGSVVDNTITTTKGIPFKGGKIVHYDPGNNVTVVTGDGGSIVSVHPGPPRAGQLKK